MVAGTGPAFESPGAHLLAWDPSQDPCCIRWWRGNASEWTCQLCALRIYQVRKLDIDDLEPVGDCATLEVLSVGAL